MYTMRAGRPRRLVGAARFRDVERALSDDLAPVAFAAFAMLASAV
jgi:hypothetical protein